jgi:aspartyl-tRNA(Asn)/glutamyl-tRNA(Gln) amidotransferase subunit A
MTLIELQAGLAAGRLTARALVEESLEKIADPSGEGGRCFLTVYADQARRQADLVDRARGHGLPLPPFAGVPLSIKDLYDVAGEVTRAGSKSRDGEAPASVDAEAVRLVRRAGFIVVGKNNMTEFAYSGLGLNGHFLSPRSPYQREIGRVPGGSTSGGAAAVADGMVPATLGSDTGGSCRLPAAFCGIVGFKPTSTRISKRGVFPLSESLDSVGPLATSVSCCAVLDSVLAGGVGDDEAPFPLAGLRLGVIEGYVDSELDVEVAGAYGAALSRLAKAGVRLMPVKIPEFAELPQINSKGSLVSAEAYALHRPWLETRREAYDPWVLARIESGSRITAADYIELLGERRRVIAAVAARTIGLDALALPTAPNIPPRIDELGDLAHSQAVNQRCLRNTAIANFLDRPSISIPCHAPGSAPVGFMLMGETGADRRLLAVARGLEGAVRGEG